MKAQVGIGLTPMRVEYTLAAGAVQSGSLTLRNESKVPARVRSEILDFYLDQNAVPQFEKSVAAEKPHSCREWLTVTPNETEVAPDSYQLVRYTLRIPEGVADKSFHCAIGYSTLPTMSNESGTGMRTAIRMVAAVYATVGNAPVVGEVSDVTVEKIADDTNTPWRAVVTLSNKSQRFYRASGDIELVDQSGKVLEKAQFPSFPVLPSREQKFPIPLKTNLEGKELSLRMRIGMGAQEIQEATVPIKIDK
ncbi:MAG: hypothetical protein HYZ37_07660 [Candidatus Solibacter usitatus]|nr:hypothetical protein [Candidatus Solibacter usitatus]